MTDTLSRVFSVRPLEKSDFPTIAGWFLDLDDLSSFDRATRIPLSLEGLEKVWTTPPVDPAQSGRHWFAIENESRQTIGIVGLEALSLISGDAIIPLFIDRANRGRGVGVRTVALMLDFAFCQLMLRRLTTYYRADNHASRALTDRVGFRKEGCLRQAWSTRSGYVDTVVIGILRQEWMDRREALASELDPGCVVGFGSPPSPNWSWPPPRERADS